MKAIWFCSLLTFVCSCSSKIVVSDYIKPGDSSANCYLASDIIKIKSQLDDQKVPIHKFQLRGEGLDKSCIGLYRIYSHDWDEYNKLNYNGVVIPILKFQDKVTVNCIFLKNHPRSSDTLAVKKDITEFKSRYADKFSEAEMKKIVDSYQYGIDVMLKGYWRN